MNSYDAKDMAITINNIQKPDVFHGFPWFSTHQNHVWPKPQDSHAHAAVQTAGQQDVEATGSLGSLAHRGGGAARLSRNNML